LREVLRDLVCDMRADFRELIMQTMELARQDLIDRFNQEWKKRSFDSYHRRLGLKVGLRYER